MIRENSSSKGLKIVHCMPNANYEVSITFIKFVNSCFDSELHDFVFWSEKDDVPRVLHDIKNVYYESIDNMHRLFKGYDMVILHSLFPLRNKDMVSLLMCSEVMKKLVWVAWGGDLYQWKKTDKSLRCHILNLLSYCFIKQIKYFVGIFPPDIDHFKMEFKTQAQTFYASYVDGLYNPIYKNVVGYVSLSEKLETGSCINIQIGHSSSMQLNHIEVLNQLSKFKNENIRIYLPLSYGDMEYGNQVKQHAKKIFGEKACCIREMMSKDNYMEFLSTIDIAIFNTTRQIGLFNIIPLMYMGKKIFMPAGSVMYNHYKSDGLDIADYKQIENMDFSDFIKSVDTSSGKHYVELNYTNKELKLEEWTRVFNILMK